MEIARRLARHRLIAVDTCVFIYLMERNPRYFDVANAVFASIESGKSSAITSTLVLTEILIQPYRNENFLQAEAFFGLLTTMPNLEWLPPSIPIAKMAAALRASYRMQTPDALIAATALLHGASAFLTNDPTSRRINGLEALILDEYV